MEREEEQIRCSRRERSITEDDPRAEDEAKAVDDLRRFRSIGLTYAELMKPQAMGE